MHRDRDTGGKELGPGGRDLDAVEIKEVELRLAILVGNLRKRDSGLAPGAEVDRVLVLVDVAGF